MWKWILVILIILGAGAFLFVKTKSSKQTSIQGANDPVIRKCIEDAIGQDRVKAIEQGSVTMTEEDQSAIGNCNKNPGNKSSQATNFYPDTDQAPVLQLKWDGTLDTSKVTRYTPFGVWENWVKEPEGLAYEPAPEMQFYFKADDQKNFLAVAPGIVVQNDVDQNKGTGIGLMTIRYGKNYSVTYYHLFTDTKLKVGDKVETGDRLGIMEKSKDDQFGEETWWEISLQKYNPETKMIRAINPYEYFNKEGKAMLDQVAVSAKKSSEFWKTADGTRSWIITGGCSYVPYTKAQEWWTDLSRLGYTPEGAINQTQDDFAKTINPNWKTAGVEQRIVGPTDKCK